LKSEGALHDWAWRRIPLLAGAALVVLGIAVVAAFIERARMTGNLLLSRHWGLVFPAAELLAMYGVFVAARRRRDNWPFALTAVFFVAALLSLAVMFWPYMIPYSVTVGSAAAPENSLSFLFWRRCVCTAGDRRLHRSRLLAVPRQAANRIRITRPAH